jgi:hypothetical protein
LDLHASKEEYWLAHLRYWNNLPLFPREFGLQRNEVYKSQYLFLLSKWYNKEDCYTSVYSEGQLEQEIYDTLFLEARDETDSLEQVLMDRDMIRGAFQKHGIACRSPLSGGRSCHFYVDFPPIPVPNLSAMARNFVTEMDIVDLLDMHTVGNRRSMARIPYTYNKRADRFAVYYDGSDPMELEFVSINGIMPEQPIMQLQDTNILKFLRPDDDYDTELLKPAEVAFNGMYPDCVLSILSKIRMYQHAGHEERMHLAAYMYKLGHSFDDIVNAFRGTTDFNPVVCEQQVRSIVGSGYKPYSCGRVKSQMSDICPYSSTGRYCHYIKRIINAAQRTS